MCSCLQNNEQAMLVLIIKLCDDAENGVIRRCCCVWLDAGNQFLGSQTHAFYLLALTGVFELFLGRANRKLMIVRRLMLVCQHQRMYNVIETGTKVVNYFSCKDGKAKWKFRVAIHAKNELIAYVFSCDSEWRRAGLLKDGDLLLQRLDGFMGSRKLCATTI